MIDVDEDGIKDVAVANMDGPDRVYLGTGDGLEEKAAWSSLGKSDSTTASDLNSGPRRLRGVSAFTGRPPMRSLNVGMITIWTSPTSTP